MLVPKFDVVIMKELSYKFALEIILVSIKVSKVDLLWGLVAV